MGLEIVQFSFFLPLGAGTLLDIAWMRANRQVLGLVAPMHEMSIAQSILEVVQQYAKESDHARDANVPRVKSVRLRIGEMAGVVPESLRFCFEVASEGTVAQGAELLIEEVPIRCRCASCNLEFSAERFLFLCPTCGTTDVEVLSGNELDVVELDLLEEADPAMESTCQ